MRSIAYWDLDSQRIKQFVSHLEANFEVSLAASLAELLRMGADGLKPYAVAIGVPPMDKPRLQALLGTMSSRFSCPIVLLGAEGDAAISAVSPGVFIHRGALSALPAAIDGEAERLAAEAGRRASLFVTYQAK